MKASLRLLSLTAALMSGQMASTTSATAAPVEHQASLNGTLYSVIAPVYAPGLDSTNGSTSFVRLFGGTGAASSSFTIIALGNVSGAQYGSVVINVPKYASPQFSANTILNMAGTGASRNSDTGFVFYIQNPEATSGFQHVTFNGTSLLFENSSVCKYLLNEDITSLYSSLVLTNLHTTQLTNYPTQIQIHNFWNSALNYGVYVYDAGTADSTSGAIRAGSGNLVGSKVYTIQGNSSLTLAMSQLQSDINWAPNSTQLHANIIVTDTQNDPPYEVLGASIVNSAYAGFINMSTACAVNAPPAAASTGGATAGAYDAPAP